MPKLVSSVNAYMVNERAVLTQVTEARAKVGTIQMKVDDLDNPEVMARFQEAQNQLSSALSRLIAVSENYPQLKSDGLFRDLMTQLEGTENRIATERGRYVQTVQEYNLFIRQFPTLITAKLFGYKVKENYGVDRSRWRHKKKNLWSGVSLMWIWMRFMPRWSCCATRICAAVPW